MMRTPEYATVVRVPNLEHNVAVVGQRYLIRQDPPIWKKITNACRRSRQVNHRSTIKSHASWRRTGVYQSQFEFGCPPLKRQAPSIRTRTPP